MGRLTSVLVASAYKHAVRPILFRHDPEIAHNRITALGEKISQRRIALSVIRYLFGQRNPLLKKTVSGIEFPSPIGLAAGFDYQAKLPWVLEALGFGFATVGTITNRPCSGNPRPWLGRLVKSQSLLVNKGFKNDGIVATLKRLQNLPSIMPVGLSIGQTNSPKIDTEAKAIDDIIACFTYAEGHPHQCRYYELNISCPNIQKHISFYSPLPLKKLLEGLERLKISRPVFIKCPVSVSDEELVGIAETASKFSFISGLVIGNLQRDRTHPTILRDELAKCGPGNFSGLPTRVRSTELIKIIRAKFGTRFAIIGCGGIFGTEDAEAKFAAGADLVQLITGLIFKGPQLVSEINHSLTGHNLLWK
ncbi:MAG: dihydroorotate dehydrogenase (quinone) [Candidatus Berkelbacteria bacterium]|nr:dihydroorotate dehydrogenase (quinone) [Candidatus Berkelbacteria bacterium]MCR4306945.1 dihydroorotate dehydrogenase (quinone) [Candidatus Berkelbacteria bacterium]